LTKHPPPPPPSLSLSLSLSLGDRGPRRLCSVRMRAPGGAQGRTFAENTADWGFCPGSTLRQGVDLAPHLAQCPDPARALEAIREAHAWVNSVDGSVGEQPGSPLAEACRPAYDLQPDVPYPERKDVNDPHTRG